MTQGRRNRHDSDSVSESATDEASDTARFEMACIESWALLQTVMPVAHVEGRLEDGLLDKLFEQLEVSASTGVHVTLCESIALLLELCYTGDESADEPDSYFRTHLGNALAGFLDQLRAFNTECTKHKSKRDRQSQRKTFREVLDYTEQLQRALGHVGGAAGGALENGNGHLEGVAKSGATIQVSRTERIELTSWCLQRYYDALRQLLGPGLSAHLRGNRLVRSIFELGEPTSAPSAEAPAPARADASSGDEAETGGGGAGRRRVARQKKGGNTNKGGEAGSRERRSGAGGHRAERERQGGNDEGSSGSEGTLTKLERVQVHQAQDRVRTKQRSRFKDKRFDRGCLDYD